MVVGYCYDISVVVDVLVGILKFFGWRELFFGLVINVRLNGIFLGVSWRL